MKSNLCCLLSLLLLGACTPESPPAEMPEQAAHTPPPEAQAEAPQPEAEDADFTLMTWNILHDKPDQPWQRRREDVLHIIGESAPDILCVQEAVAHQVEDLREHTSLSWVAIGRDDGENGGEHVGIGYNADRFTLMNQGCFWLSETPEEPGSIGWDAAIQRHCVWVHLQDLRERHWLVLGTHFDHVGHIARIQSAALIAHRARATEVALQTNLIASDVAVVVLGDFNASQHSRIAKFLFDEGLVPVDMTLQLSPDVMEAEHWSFNNLDDTAPRHPKIDWITVDAQLTPLCSHVRHDRPEGRYPSDHDPVLADVQWTQPHAESVMPENPELQ